MASVTVDDFKIGKDSRKGDSVADADRLLQLTNAYINKGKIPKKRQGSDLDVTLEGGTKGIISANGVLNTFYGKGSITHGDPGYKAHLVNATVGHTLFSGSSLDDCNASGEYSGLSDSVFDVVIDAVSNFAITIFADSGTNPGTHTTVTAVGHTFSNTENVEIAGTTSYNGNHVIQDVGVNVFDIPVPFVADDATGTAENSTWKWRKDSGGYSSAVVIVPDAFLSLSDGVQVKFDTAGNGRIALDQWTFSGVFYNSVETVHFGDNFLGFLYVVIEYDTGLVRHHYLDGADNTVIKDPNCPHSKGVTKMESKIWAVNGDTVAFSAVANPRDWTTTEDAGFLPTGLRSKNADNAIALGQYGNHQLVVLFEDGAQLWDVDPDPALNTYRKDLDGFHTRFPRSVLKFAGDLFVLGDGGVRSTTEKVFSENINEEDVGSPIDKDIKAVLSESSNVISGRYKNIGQYWLVIDDNVFVYTFSRTAKISAWSIYSYPFAIDAMEEIGGKFYLRSGNNVYLVNEETFNDNGVPFKSTIQTAFLNAKQPGQDKQWHGLDVVLKGSADISFLWNPNNPDAKSIPVSIGGDTTPTQRAPIEVVSPSLSFLYENSLDEEFELQSFTAYFDTLGVQ